MNAAEYQATASERDIQKAIVQELRLRGYIVMETGQWRADRAGNSKGLPDVIFTRQGWGNRWSCIEVKTAKGRVRKEQQELVYLGVVHIARSVEDARRIIEEVGECSE